MSQQEDGSSFLICYSLLTGEFQVRRLRRKDDGSLVRRPKRYGFGVWGMLRVFSGEPWSKTKHWPKPTIGRWRKKPMKKLGDKISNWAMLYTPVKMKEISRENWWLGNREDEIHFFQMLPFQEACQFPVGVYNFQFF